MSGLRANSRKVISILFLKSSLAQTDTPNLLFMETLLAFFRLPDAQTREALQERKFESYRPFSAIVVFACAFFALGLWVWDFAVDPVNAPKTLDYRLLQILALAPFAAYLWLGKLPRLRLLFLILTIIGSQSLYILTLNVLDDGHTYGSGGFLYWFIFVPLMGAGFTLRENIIALIVIVAYPMLFHLLGFSPKFPVAVYCVYSLSTFAIVLLILFLSDAIILRLITAQDELTKARDEAIALAQTDYLTGTNNRRAFFDYGKHALAEALRYKHPLSVIMMDIDKFKLINDSLGHAIGDAVIKALTVKVLEMIRDVDILGRLGGEEFAVLLPQTNGEDAYKLAERIREAIAHSTIASGGNIIDYTVSMGVAEYLGADQSLDVLIARADEGLYLAKEQGRNMVVSVE